MTRDLPERNNFDLVRFTLAMMVCLVHAGQLPGMPELQMLAARHALATEVAVPAFFAVSGLLIMRSYERSRGFWPYLEKRARRILPGYLLVVLGAALALGPLSSAPAFYFTRDWWAYLGANLSTLGFLHPTLPGVFDTHVVPAVNGALWTIKIEIAFYLLAPLLVMAQRRIGAPALIGLVFLLSTFWAMTMRSPFAHQLPGQLRYFMVGAAFYYGWPWIQPRLLQVGAAAATLLLAHQVAPLGPLYPIAIGGAVLAFALAPSVGDFGQHGDFSYGIYILHFPIVQVLIELGAFQRSPWGGVFAAVVLTLGMAVPLWHLVEAPVLGRRHRRPAHLHSLTGPGPG
ncbi:acyltransferase [Mitsuaria sp. GD03876]|uniref:acyltransferase family protein n=1 Tax=Mitsuaria sp. GD03876 TaxID=2975399 RepID=UPI00244D5752|nr:acyltransferase [Mitsuaria sp. GD03876]MDH0864692.1 acyltransferase [Mitsuaria sp. GD03876]